MHIAIELTKAEAIEFENSDSFRSEIIKQAKYMRLMACAPFKYLQIDINHDDTNYHVIPKVNVRL